MKSKMKKLIYLIACFTMLLSTTITASAKYEVCPRGDVICVANPPVSTSEAEVRNAHYDHIYYFKSDGSEVELASGSEIPAVGENGLPLWIRPDSAVDVLYVYEVSGTTPGGVYTYTDWSMVYLDDQIVFLLAMIDAAGVTNEMSQYEKCVAIADYICGVMTYDQDENGNPGALKLKMLDPGNPDRPADFNHDPAADILGDGLNCMYWLGVGVCQDYADLFQSMCETIGIKCEMMTSDTLNHAWNEVLADWKTYYVDVTWLDTGSRSREYLMSETLWPDHNVNRWIEYYGYSEDEAMMMGIRMILIVQERAKGRTMASMPYVKLTLK